MVISAGCTTPPIIGDDDTSQANEEWSMTVSADTVSLSEAQPYKQVLVMVYGRNLEPYGTYNNVSLITKVSNPTLFGYDKTYFWPLEASPNGTVVQPQYVDVGYFGGAQDNTTQITAIMTLTLYVDGETRAEQAILLQYDKQARAGVAGEYYMLIIHNPDNKEYAVQDAVSVWASGNETYAQYLLPAGIYTITTPDGNLSVTLIGHGALVDLSLLTVQPVSEGMPITTSTVLFYVVAGAVSGVTSFFVVHRLKEKGWFDRNKRGKKR